MSALKPRHTVKVVHFDSTPGKPPVFFLTIARDGDPASCQRLIPLDLGAIGALTMSIDTAMIAHNKLRRAQLPRTERMTGKGRVIENGAADDRLATLLACYRSGQMTDAQMQDHLRDETGLADRLAAHLHGGAGHA